MKRLPNGRWFVVGFGAAALLMGVVSASSYQNAMHLIDNTNQSKQTYGVIKALVDIFATMTVAESGRRGYLFFGDERERQRYQAAMEQMPNQVKALEQQLAHDPLQTERLMQLKMLLNQRMTLLNQSIDLRQRNPAATLTQSQLTEESVALRDRIQQLIAEMQDQEEQQLQQALARSRRNIRGRILLESLITSSSLLLLFTIYALYHQQLIRRQQAETMQYNLEKTQELSNLKLRFFSMVSHEFRTPLSVILGSAQLLQREDQTWSEARKQKNLQRIQASAKLMTQLLTDILTLTRAEAGKLEFNPQLMDIEAFCLNLIDELQLSDPAYHRVQFISQGQCRRADLDEKLLYSMLSNLLSNAVKYSSPDQPIVLQLDCQPHEIQFQVRDHGRGISQVDQEYLYEPFFRSSDTTDIAGTGLGLAVVKTCVELHSGEITVASELGMGTTFTIRIPQ